MLLKFLTCEYHQKWVPDLINEQIATAIFQNLMHSHSHEWRLLSLIQEGTTIAGMGCLTKVHKGVMIRCTQTYNVCQNRPVQKKSDRYSMYQKGKCETSIRVYAIVLLWVKVLVSHSSINPSDDTGRVSKRINWQTFVYIFYYYHNTKAFLFLCFLWVFFKYFFMTSSILAEYLCGLLCAFK